MNPLATYVGNGGATPWASAQTIKLPRPVDGAYIESASDVLPTGYYPPLIAHVLNPKRGAYGILITTAVGGPRSTSRGAVPGEGYVFVQGDELIVSYFWNLQGVTYNVYAIPDQPTKRFGFGLLP